MSYIKTGKIRSFNFFTRLIRETKDGKSHEKSVVLGRSAADDAKASGARSVKHALEIASCRVAIVHTVRSPIAAPQYMFETGLRS